MTRPKVIVLVDDEWIIRLDTAEALRIDGFEIIEAGNGDEALELLQLHHKLTHVLFTDVRMPGAMDGVELAHHVRTHWPWIAILVASANARLT